MKIGMIGAGMIARAVAEIAVKNGHEVMFSNSRGPETLFTLSRTLGCKAGTPEEAALFGDIVFVAVPLKDYRKVPVAALKGKVVIDANNYYPERDGHILELDEKRTTTSQMLADHLGQSKIVKAFNAIMAPDVLFAGHMSATHEKRALPIAGDDQLAKDIVRHFIEGLGFDVVDAGPLAESWRFEEGRPVYCVPLTHAKLTHALAETQR